MEATKHNGELVQSNQGYTVPARGSLGEVADLSETSDEGREWMEMSRLVLVGVDQEGIQGSDQGSAMAVRDEGSVGILVVFPKCVFVGISGALLCSYSHTLLYSLRICMSQFYVSGALSNMNPLH